MSQPLSPEMEIREVDEEKDLSACFALMRQLRPHLQSETEFVERWRRQRTAAGYRLIGLWQEDRLMALAGFRVLENLVHGRHLYVDDLVTDEGARSCGHGGQLIRYLQEEAARLECAKLLLDTPMSNALGHRFYFRQGFLATSLRFTMVLPEGAANPR
jgi:ribosomal protein S18 acetylase RimI-like enzyme